MLPLSNRRSDCIASIPEDADIDVDIEDHRGRPREHAAKRENLQKLLEAETSTQYWTVLCGFLDDVRLKSKLVSMEAMRTAFEERINPPLVTPGHFDLERKMFNDFYSSAIPSQCELWIQHQQRSFLICSPLRKWLCAKDGSGRGLLKVRKAWMLFHIKRSWTYLTRTLQTCSMFA